MRISDWSSDVCSSDLCAVMNLEEEREAPIVQTFDQRDFPRRPLQVERMRVQARDQHTEFALAARIRQRGVAQVIVDIDVLRFFPGRLEFAHALGHQPLIERRGRWHLRALSSEEHTSELPSLMHIPY